MDQWVDFLTNPPSEYGVPNINRLIEVFPVTDKNYGRPYPDIKLLGKPVKALKDLLWKRQNIRG